MTRLLLLLCLLLAPAAAALAAAEGNPPAAGGDPAAPVERLHSALLDTWSSGAEFPARVERLAPVVADTLDLGLMARFTLGDAWGRLEPAQRQEFVDLFGRLTVATYADRFDDYSGERFETLETRELAGGRALVRTTLVKADGERVSLDYLLHRADGQWRIANILAKGVSDLAVKRSEYRSVIQREGFPALRSQLESKVQALGEADSPG